MCSNDDTLDLEKTESKLSKKDWQLVHSGKFTDSLTSTLFKAVQSGQLSALNKEMELINEHLAGGKSDFKLAGFLDKSADGQGLTLWLALKKDSEKVRDLAADLSKNGSASKFFDRASSMTIGVKLLDVVPLATQRAMVASRPLDRIGSLSKQLLEEKPRSPEKPPESRAPGETKKPGSHRLIESAQESYELLIPVAEPKKDFRPEVAPASVRAPQLTDYSPARGSLMEAIFKEASKQIRDVTRREPPPAPKK